MLRRALDGDRAQRLLALQALDARADGPGLGVLAPDGSAPLAPATAAALQRLGGALRARVFALVDDRLGGRVARLARCGSRSPRVAAKLGEPGLTPARIVAAAATGRRRCSRTPPLRAGVIAAHHPEARAAIPAAVAPLLADTTSGSAAGGRRDAGDRPVPRRAPARGGRQGPFALRALGGGRRRRRRWLGCDAGGGGCRPRPGGARRGGRAPWLERRGQGSGAAASAGGASDALPASLVPSWLGCADPSDLVRGALEHLEP